ncbi:hypothetical protein C0J52_11260 [Blattella germanica]|nr:hypothetical protein C0J52_11260 [Blattella germanica]
MGNASSHHKAGGVAEKVPGGDLGKNGAEFEEQEQMRKRSSVGVESDRDVIPLVCPEPLSERQKELLVETWKELEQNIAQKDCSSIRGTSEAHHSDGTGDGNGFPFKEDSIFRLISAVENMRLDRKV